MRPTPTCVRHGIAPLFVIAFTLTTITGCPAAKPPAKQAKPKEPEKGAKDKDERKTVTYDVTELAQRYPDGLDELLVNVMRMIEPEEWRKGANTAHLVTGEIGHPTLVVTATAKRHEQIDEYLKAWTLNFDADVVLKTWMYEVERKVFQKKVEPLLAKQADEKSRVELAKQLGKATLVAESGQFIHERHEGTFFSYRQAYLFKRWPDSRFADSMRSKAYEIGFHGVTYKAKVFASGDRRHISLRLTEQTTELTEMTRVKEGEGTVDFAKTQEKSTTFPTVQVEDGEAIFRHLSWKTLEGKKTNREIVLAIRPVIYIEREQRERAKFEEEARKKPEEKK
jgi:hypothetical protein